MHCGRCVAKLTEALNNVASVDSASVTLDPPVATIESQSPIEVAEIQAVVASAGDYSAEVQTATSPAVAAAPAIAPKSAATYFPLILIVGFLLGGSALLQVRTETWNWPAFMSDFMGGFFIVFAFFKLLDIGGFADSYQSYDIVAARWRGYGLVYPFIELALGLAYVARFELFYTNIATIVVMTIGSIGVLQSVLSQRKIQCACLGTVFNLPMSTVTLVEDLGMVAMAIIMLAFSIWPS